MGMKEGKVSAAASDRGLSVERRSRKNRKPAKGRIQVRMLYPGIVGAVVLGIAMLAGAARRDNGKSRNADAPKAVSLFDGKTLQGWMALTSSGHEVSADESAFSAGNGVIHCSGKGKDYWLATRRKYRHVVIEIEYSLPSGATSGVFLRAPDRDRPAYKGYEVQIIDDFGKDPTKHGSGSVYDVLTPMRNMLKPVGQWNRIEITHRGSHVKVVLNGFKVIDADFNQLKEPIGKFDFPYAEMPREGYIGVQNHGGELWFRNLRIRELKPRAHSSE